MGMSRIISPSADEEMKVRSKDKKTGNVPFFDFLFLDFRR